MSTSPSEGRNAALFERARGVIPDRFFWALPEEDEEGAVPGEAEPGEAEGATAPRNPRHVH